MTNTSSATDRLDRTRQQGLIPDRLFKGTEVAIIGVGGIGSPTAVSLGKMGVERIVVYDDDGVNTHNVPNQWYRKQDIGQYKVDAIGSILRDFTDCTVELRKEMFVGQRLPRTVIVATDSMASRTLVWNQFLVQPQTRNIIEARMGAKLGMVYTLSKETDGHGRWRIDPDDAKFYQSRLYSDDKVKPAPCTARAIIYNTLMISSLICRAYESILMRERDFPRELIFSMSHIDERSLMFRK